MARASSRIATPGDMVRSLAVILIPVVIITYFFTRTPDGPRSRASDWSMTLPAPFVAL